MKIGFLTFEPQRFDEYAEVCWGDANRWSMSPQEGLFLCGYLTAIRARRVIEIGSNIGHSALYIAHALRAVGHPDARLDCFEISERAQTARENLARFGYDSFALVHQADSRGDEARRVRSEVLPVDAVLIDGDHSFEGSYADFQFWHGAVRPGGLLFFHDSSEDFEQTYRAVGLRSIFTTLHTIEQRHPGYTILRLEPPHYHNNTSMAVVQKPPPPKPSAAPSPPTNGARSSFWGRASQVELSNRPWENLTLPNQASFPVTMLQIDELKYLYWLARQRVDPKGDIVELGAWQGGSTAALCEGIRHRRWGRRRSRVYVYDRFVWDEYSASFCPQIELRPGDDMEPLFRSNTRPWANLIEVRRGNVEDARWNPAQAISCLFVDLAKDPRTLQFIWNRFGPGLRPGSIVVFQDFKHYWTSFLPVLVPLFPSLRPVHACRDGCSISFEFEGSFKPVELPPLDEQLVDEQFQAACEFFAWDPPTAAAFEYGWIFQLLNLRSVARARARFEAMRDRVVSAGAADGPPVIAQRLATAS